MKRRRTQEKERLEIMLKEIEDGKLAEGHDSSLG
jgi:hypothetical protein